MISGYVNRPVDKITNKKIVSLGLVARTVPSYCTAVLSWLVGADGTARESRPASAEVRGATSERARPSASGMRPATCRICGPQVVTARPGGEEAL